MSANRTRRRDALALGRWAEVLCAWWLRLKGYRVLARNLKTPRGVGVGEIDILARRGRQLVIVEVKARATLEEAAAAISPRQRARLERAAAWVQAGPFAPGTDSLRFDAMLVAPWRMPRHVVDALH